MGEGDNYKYGCMTFLQELSEEGYYGLVNKRENTWTHNLWNLGYEITPYTRGQMTPSS